MEFIGATRKPSGEFQSFQLFQRFQALGKK